MNRFRRCLMICLLMLCVLLYGSLSGRVAAGQEEPAPKTPEDRLFVAVGHSDVAAVRTLLERGVDPNAPNRWKMPPLVEAAGRGGNGPEILTLLLDHGADVNGTDSQGFTPLMEAASAPMDAFGQDSAVKRIHLLADRGADVNYKNAAGQTALTVAMFPGHGRIVRALLDRGADTHVAGPFTPLHFAAYASDLARVIALLKAGADVNAKDSSGRSPLLLAAEGADMSTLQALLDAGANVNVRDASGQTPLLQTLQANAPEAALLLVRKGADANAGLELPQHRVYDTPLMLALRMNMAFPREEAQLKKTDALIAALLDAGADVNAGGFDMTPLMGAIQRERFVADRPHVNWVKPLLDRGANVNAQTPYGTALSVAIEARRKDLDIPKLLIDRGADVNTVNGSLSVLLAAIGAQDFALAALLVEHGANVECFDKARKTPLLWAAYYGQLELLKLLLAHGANLNAQDALGQNALILAEKGQHPEVAAFLKEKGVTPPLPAAPVPTNAQGQTVVRLPLTVRQGVPPGGMTFATDENGQVPRLLIRKGMTLFASPVTFEALFRDPALWTPDERNNNLYQLGRSYYSADAYRFFGLATVKSGTYLGLFWYSPAASAQDQIVQFVFRLHVDGRALELTVARKSLPGGGNYLTRTSRLPILSRSAGGDLLLADGNGTFRYLPNGTWQQTGPAPKDREKDR
jgi:ankyrin repeat protein